MGKKFFLIPNLTLSCHNLMPFIADALVPACIWLSLHHPMEAPTTCPMGQVCSKPLPPATHFFRLISLFLATPRALCAFCALGGATFTASFFPATTWFLRACLDENKGIQALHSGKQDTPCRGASPLPSGQWASPPTTGGSQEAPGPPPSTEALTLVISPNADLFLGPPWGDDEDLLA